MTNAVNACHAPEDLAQLEVFNRELATLKPLLAAPMTKDRLDHWVGELRVRADILADTVWGTIRWSKALGRPYSATLAGAFKIEHTHVQFVKEFVQGGARYIELTVPHAEPSKWDGPEDDEYFRVSFMASAAEGQQTRIRVNFANGVGWEPRLFVTGRGYRDIEPAERRFAKSNSRLVLEPFDVVSKPYLRVL